MPAEDTFDYHSNQDRYATRALPIQPALSPSADTPPVGVSRSHQDPDNSNHSGRSRAGLIVGSILGVVLVAGAAAGGGLYYLDQSYQGKIYPNVSVQGIDLSEQTPGQAESAIRAKYAAFLQQPITLTYGDKTWSPSADELGIRFDFANAANQAYQAGRGNGLIADVQNVYAIWQNGLELPISASFDQAKMQAYLRSVTADLEAAPVDAQLSLNGTTVTTRPSQMGRQVLLDETVQEVTRSLATFTPQTVAVRTRDLPPRLNDAAVAEGKAAIEAYLQAPFTMTVEGKKEYTWAPEDIAPMLTITRVGQPDGTDTIGVDVSTYQINKRIVAIAEETGRGSVNPRVAWNDGNLTITKPGRSGMRVDEAAAAQQVIEALNGQNRAIALPVQDVQPQVTEANLNTLGINELVSVGRSDFSGSAPYRIQNIGAGMRLLNGILIGPGEEFSFNQNIGNIDESNGFVQGYAIIQNRTQLEFGGGICQDSTTLFRAAFWAGLPITERWGHSFYISWYDKYALGQLGAGPGMDATIFTGGPDLKFINDTGNWLLMQSYSNPSSGIAEVAFYGTKPNRTVSLSQKVYDRIAAPTEPVYVPDRAQPRGNIKQTDTARGGMTIDVYRVITENGTQQKPQLFRTTFKPWPNIYVANPADLGPNGKPRPRPTEQPQATAQPTADPAQAQSTADPAQAQPTADPAQAQPTADPAQPQPTD